MHGLLSLSFFTFAEMILPVHLVCQLFQHLVHLLLHLLPHLLLRHLCWSDDCEFS